MKYDSDPTIRSFVSVENVEHAPDAYGNGPGYASASSTGPGHAFAVDIHLTPTVNVKRTEYQASTGCRRFSTVTLGHDGRVSATVYVTTETAAAARKLAAALMLAAETVEP